MTFYFEETFLFTSPYKTKKEADKNQNSKIVAMQLICPMLSTYCNVRNSVISLFGELYSQHLKLVLEPVDILKVYLFRKGRWWRWRLAILLILLPLCPWCHKRVESERIVDNT